MTYCFGVTTFETVRRVAPMFGVFLLAACTNGSAGMFDATPDEALSAPLIEGVRSDLPDCEVGPGVCGNGIVMLCEGVGLYWKACVVSPSGDVERRIDVDVATATLAPSGQYLLSMGLQSGGDSFVLDLSTDEIVEVANGSQWLGIGDALYLTVEEGLRVLTVDGQVTEEIAAPSGRGRLSVQQVSPSGQKMLVSAIPIGGDRIPDTELWVWDWQDRTWGLVYAGEDFVNFGTRGGFTPGEDSVVVQVSDIRMMTEELDSFGYSVIRINLADQTVNVIAESSGTTGQFASVSPDGHTVATMAEDLLYVIDVESGAVSGPVKTRAGAQFVGPDWSSDSSLLVTGDYMVHAVTAGPEPAVGLPVDVRIDKNTTALSPDFP